MQALVIDDSRAMRMVLSKMLQQAGFETVEQAGHGEEGLERLQEMGSADVVLVDWNMPVMNGITFIETLREKDTTTPVVMVTTEVEIERVEHALAAGADEYVMKPFTCDMIVEKLRMIGVEV